MSIWESLPPNRLRAAQLLAAGWDIQTAAKEAHVELTTLYGWRSEPEFKQAVHELKMEIHDAFVSKVHGLVQTAADRLEAMIGQQIDAPITYRDQLTAIKMVTDMAAENMRTEALMKEVEQLRAMLQQSTLQSVHVETLPPAEDPDAEADTSHS